MNISEQKRNIKNFIDEWQNRGLEKQDSQSFWLSLLREVLGVEKPENLINFEVKVKLTHESFIDGYIKQTSVLIEQKGRTVNLDKPIRQSDGTILTPFQQAQRYSAGLPYSERPRWIVTCNFKEFRIYDMEQPNSEPQKIELKDLVTDYYRLEFLVDKSNEHIEKEKQVSLNAGELVGKIYDELLKQYKYPDNEHSQKSINQLCVRIVFCLYAEDAGIFGRKNMFHDYLEQFDAQHLRKALINLFKVLDTKEEDRDPYLADDDPKLAEFPYVNGGMFSDEDIEIPPFTEELRDLLLRNASDEFNWSKISPTIFGAVFESTLNPETRHQGGMHYTSVENIHKVIDPLFLDDLKDELNEIKKTRQPAALKRKARAFQEKLSNLTFFDPACGSGNFLTETYLQLRKLENSAIRLLHPNPELEVGQSEDIIEVSIQQFYGIEINDFAVSVAKTALWIAESQMLEKTKDIFYHSNWDFLPLKTYTNIHEGNALNIDWNSILPNYVCSYIIGNPPFIGYGLQDQDQKNDIRRIYVDQKGKPLRNAGKIDYVAGWYYKASEYIYKTDIKVAFVSTNSITQGDQVFPVWQPLFNMFKIHIDFAYKTFIWNSEAKEKAHVHVVIIGFSCSKNKKTKLLFSGNTYKKVDNISAYLIDAPNILVKSVSRPLCAVPKMVTGNRPADGGHLIIEQNDFQDFIKKEPKAKRWIKYLVGSNEFINGKKRYCLWLVGITPKELNSMPLIKKRVKLTQDDRLKGAKDRQKLAETPWLFREQQNPSKYLIVPATSSERRRYIPIGYLNGNYIPSNSATIIPDASLYAFGVLESNMHMAWVRTVAGRLKSDYRYSAKIVYNNFPWPDPTKEQKDKIDKTAKSILDARALYPDSSLADLYDPLTMPQELLKAHRDNDRAVMAAYGLPVKRTTESDAAVYLLEMYEKLISARTKQYGDSRG